MCKLSGLRVLYRFSIVYAGSAGDVRNKERFNQNADDADAADHRGYYQKRSASIRSTRFIRVLLTRTPI
jgi:hypothetical protein